MEKTRPTAITVSENLIFIGMSNGVINAFTKEGQKLFGTYHDTAKEYYQNAVTCMDVHPKRPAAGDLTT